MVTNETYEMISLLEDRINLVEDQSTEDFKKVALQLGSLWNVLDEIKNKIREREYERV